jgi:hypothetical protein
MIGAIFAPWMPLPSSSAADVAKVRQAGGVSASVEPSRTVRDGAKRVSGDSVPASPMGKVDSDISVVAGFLDWMTSGDCGRDATTLLQDCEDPMLLESRLQPFRLQPSATVQSTHRGMAQPRDVIGELLAQPISGRLHPTASWSSLSEEECMDICATSQVAIVDDVGSVISST